MKFDIWSKMSDSLVEEAKAIVKEAEEDVEEAKEFVLKKDSYEARNLLQHAKNYEQNAKRYLDCCRFFQTVFKKITNGEITLESANKLVIQYNDEINRIKDDVERSIEEYLDAYGEFCM